MRWIGKLESFSYIFATVYKSSPLEFTFIVHFPIYVQLVNKVCLFSFESILFSELEIFQAYKNCIEFIIILKQLMSEMLEKKTFYQLISTLPLTLAEPLYS